MNQVNQVNQEDVKNQELGLHVQMRLIVPPSIPRPLPCEVEIVVNMPTTATPAEFNQVVDSISLLLDSYAQAIQAQTIQGQTMSAEETK
jgi:hypothetical protein